MATEKYLTLPVLIDGVSQVQLQDVTVNFDSKKTPVELRKGLGGFTPGAKAITISFKSAVLISGPEFDPVMACHEDTQHEIQVPYGVKTIVSQGEFMNGSLTNGVGSATDLSFEFMGTYNKPK